MISGLLTDQFFDPAFNAPTTRVVMVASSTDWPLTLTIMSPRLSPDLSAGLSSVTLLTIAPRASFSPTAAAQDDIFPLTQPVELDPANPDASEVGELIWRGVKQGQVARAA